MYRDWKETFVYIALCYGHLILCQSSGFIRADNIDGSQCFHGGKFSYDGIDFDHAGYTHGKYDGYNCRKSFRDCSDCEGNRGDQHFQDISFLQHGYGK